MTIVRVIDLGAAIVAPIVAAFYARRYLSERG